MPEKDLVFNRAWEPGNPAELVLGDDADTPLPGINLVFNRPFKTGTPVELVFGDDGGGGGQVLNAALVIAARLPGLRVRSLVHVRKDLIAAGRLPGVRCQGAVRYNTDTQRPLANGTTVVYENAVPTRDGLRSRWQESVPLPTEIRSTYQKAVPLQVSTRTQWSEAVRLHQGAEVRFQEAERLATAVLRATYQEGQRVRSAVRALFEEAERLATPVLRARYQEAYRDRRNLTAVHFQQAIPYSASWTEKGGAARPLTKDWVTRYQEAMKPPIGMWIRPEPPEPDPCYIPELPAHLVFVDPWTGSPNLLFVCDRHEPLEPGETIVVPIKEVYLTINSAVLVRVDNGNFIPTTAMAMSLDVDSWTWSFSASVPGSALDQVKPGNDGTLVIVQATINGTAYRFAVEKVTRERTFNSSQLRVNGRGIAAELDGPYAPQMSFGNTQPRNARQLLDDILTYNNVPIGWDIGTFEPTDWAVPAGVFSHVGSYISALNAVAGAAGAYLQPHNTSRTMDVRLRYPTPAWEWASVTPQFELPAAVTTQEGFEWTDKPKYNRVFVSGQEHGILGQYTRSGTAGDLVAPSVVDPLITEAAAARQRGRAIISDTGRIATVTLRLPVLAETGIIKPGNFVHYVEGGNTHIGLTRGVSVAVGLPTIYQTLTVETHVEPV